MSALVGWKAVQKMLDDCAPGWTWQLKTHFRLINAKGRTYPTLPKNAEIEVGHLRKMARHLGILECAKKHLP